MGHLLGNNGDLRLIEAKVAGIQAFPEPQDVFQLKHVLGNNHYRCYSPNAGKVAAPINELTQQNAVWGWGPRQAEAFKQLKHAQTTEPVLRQPDENIPFLLLTYWSDTGIGAVLAHIDDAGQEYIVACTSKSLNIHERRYTLRGSC